jgi:hypothetical protein
MRKKKKLPKPRPFKMPNCGFLSGVADQEANRWFQVYSSGSLEAKTARKFAHWLLKVADWMDDV